MTKSDIDFEGWFEIVVLAVKEKSGVRFRDEDSVRDDYKSGASAYCVADEIAAEYGE